jgi:hypothetical protein
MAEDILPNEVKRLMYEYLDLDSIKNLRQVSSSWAAVGRELLLLPSFTVKSYSVDIPRLISIGSSPEFSEQAAKIVKTISFRSIDWDPDTLRTKLIRIGNEQEQRRIYDMSHGRTNEILDIEPTNRIEDALDEIDAVTKQRQVDEILADDIDALALALRLVPRVDEIRIECPNLSEHMVLRKAWDECKLEIYSNTLLGNHSNQLVSLLLASRKAELKIRHLYHSQLCSALFTAQNDLLQNEVYSFLGELQSLGLVIYDAGVLVALGEVLSSLRCLESLFVEFARGRHLPLDLVQLPLTSRLHDLWLKGLFLIAPKLFSFLEQQGCTVRRLSISSAWLREDEASNNWRSFLGDLRDKFGPQLRKFQLSGINGGGRQGGWWQLWPIYKSDWTDETITDRTEATRNIEDFVLRNGTWPMENDVPGFCIDE